MPDLISTKPGSDDPVTPPQAGPGDNPLAAAKSRRDLASFCAAMLLGAFFLPWLDLGIFGSPNGPKFARGGGLMMLLWLWPVLCLLTVAAGVSKASQQTLGQLAAAAPFAVLVLGLRDDRKLIQVLDVGAYAALGLGVALFILARRQK